MVDGEFWSDSEGDDEDEAGAAKTVLLGRRGLDQRLDLHHFELADEQSEHFRPNMRIKEKIDELMALGHITDEVRKEFNLPKDMHNRDVDFKEVRIQDAIAAIKTPVWSG